MAQFFSILNSKIELWELQRFLWMQYGSRLSDEFFDHITQSRQLCDPLDGTLSPAAFLDLIALLLSRSSAARGLAMRETRMWSTVLAGIRGVAGSKECKAVDETVRGDEEAVNHSEVRNFDNRSSSLIFC